MIVDNNDADLEVYSYTCVRNSLISNNELASTVKTVVQWRRGVAKFRGGGLVKSFDGGPLRVQTKKK